MFDPAEVNSAELGQIIAEEAERKQKARLEKELAWQKVRRFLVEEEQKASLRQEMSTNTTSKSVDDSATHPESNGDSFGTVRLLDSVRSGEDFAYNRSVSSDVDAAPIVDSSLARPKAASADLTAPAAPVQVTKEAPTTFAGHMDRMGNRLAQFLNRGPSTESSEEDSGILKSRRMLPSLGDKSSNEHPFIGGKASDRITLMATLEQITRMCQRTDLSEGSMARISTHLASINQIVCDDMDKKSGLSKRGIRRLSRTNRPKEERDQDGQDKDAEGPILPVEEESSGFMITVIPSPMPENLNVASTVLNSFKAFEAAQDLGDTLMRFNKLVADCGLEGTAVDEPWQLYSHIKAAIYNKLSFRCKQLFRLLDARFNVDVYKSNPASRKRVCIIGGGPVGLRAAIETALLGGQVVVLEKRALFSRENMLHLWPWVVQDLASIGAKVLFPQFSKSSSYFHISTRQLQLVLLKVALLVGVTVYSSTSFESLVAPTSDDKEKPFYTVTTEPQIPTMEFTAVLSASGNNDKLADSAGINRFVFCRKEALGIVCYFPNLGTSEEAKVKEFSWTSQVKHQMLDKLREVGIDIENIVYYRGEMHYLVMTPKRQNLVQRQVVNEDLADSADLVLDENVNSSALHEYVNAVVDFVGIPRKTEFTRVSLFDFSSRSRADKAANVLTAHGKKLYVGLIGDSLLEPLWHEDVGTCRGFLSAMDSVWMIAQIGKQSDEQLLADRENGYRVMQTVSTLRREDLRKNVRKYTVDPASRYSAGSLQSAMPAIRLLQ
ncbi:hypothetical protein PHYBOEH_011782 [Phytophthora boehmeriae]|uniref:[F-actin]-monooxygenase MICAL1-3-like Rossman domain-containing protein n=1 Tax=Phytophthora boehmeriae TaxID=109152 RepID=A0A8T1WXW3_9STRA|nr:hypothetical protein PHYBOEH_011782 [Phytophthora boehmeriae]